MKAVYTYNPENNKIELLVCLSPSPSILDSSMIKSYYKYDLIQREFKRLPDRKDFAIIVDGVAMSDIRWIL